MSLYRVNCQIQSRRSFILKNHSILNQTELVTMLIAFAVQSFSHITFRLQTFMKPYPSLFSNHISTTDRETRSRRVCTSASMVCSSASQRSSSRVLVQKDSLRLISASSLSLSWPLRSFSWPRSATISPARCVTSPWLSRSCCFSREISPAFWHTCRQTSIYFCAVWAGAVSGG